MFRALRLFLSVFLPVFVLSQKTALETMSCTTLSVSFPSLVFFPGSDEYTTSTGSYFAAFENELHPSCVVKPHNAKELAEIVQVISPSALSGQIQLAIRGGGHTPWAGSANINNGITLDLQKMTGVNVNPQTNVVSIGAGERWQGVYENLGARGLAVAGGRVSKVGVAGLITGGGLSYFSAATGFVCDNVINYEIVLASGEIVQVNENSYPDLFLALKGGSNNFGIVTRFDLPTFQQGKMWGGAIYYKSSAYPQIIQAFTNFAASSSPDEQAHVIVATSWSAGQETGVSNIYHTEPVAAPPSLAPFTAIQPQIFSSLRQDSLLGFAEEQSAFSTDGARQLYFTTSFRLDVQLMLDIRDLWLDALGPIKVVPGLMLSLVFQPLTQGILSKSGPRGGNSLGLTPEDGPLVITLLNSVHTKPSDDERVVAAVLALIESIESLAAKREKASRYRFMNYGYKTQNVLQGYGKENLERLRRVSKMYDPQGFFQRAVPGGFKLSKAGDFD